MSNEELQAAAAVMIAASEGRPIQVFDDIRDRWEDVSQEDVRLLVWNWNRYRYRIKDKEE